ncbi:MAG: IS21 family transposase [Actinomycetota bacterium]|nr:IS21 family transposase [Actinomycetota bacterium]
MERWNKIRMQVERQGVSIREIQRETGLHFKTIKKILAHPAPLPFDCPERPKPKIGRYLERISSILDADKDVPKKQRHTAKRIFERIQEEGYTGGYTAVKDVVRDLKRTSQEVFVPLMHRPGEAQMDFGQALVKMGGVLRKVMFFAMALPYSDAMFVVAYARECTETFQDGHVRAFEFFGGVPSRISYDNAKTSVSQIIGAHARKLTNGFLQLQSHYLFEEHFCRVRRANEKGVVEGVVKFARLNYFVPVPEVKDFEELNAFLEQRCRQDLDRTLRGRKVCKKELLVEDQQAFLALPATPFDACKKVSTTADRLSLVRFDCNDYSVPVRFAHHTVVAKGYTDHVCIFRKDLMIAEHERIWDKEGIAFNPVHYLELLERKPGALDHAKPLHDWELPESFSLLRNRLEDEGRAQGTREFIRVLRLLEKHPLAKVATAIEKALRLRRCNRDVVANYLYPDEAFSPPTFRLDGREHLQGIIVPPPDLRAYRILMGRQN